MKTQNFAKKKVFWVTKNLFNIVFQKRLITFNSGH